jgi:tetratricopeptide (TPR) repeat protein
VGGSQKEKMTGIKSTLFIGGALLLGAHYIKKDPPAPLANLNVSERETLISNSSVAKDHAAAPSPQTRSLEKGGGSVGGSSEDFSKTLVRNLRAGSNLDYCELSSLSEKLRDKDPANPEVIRLDLQAKTFAAVSGKMELSPLEWLEISKDLQRVQEDEKHVGNEPIAYLVDNRGADLESVRKMALEEIALTPKDPVAHEILGLTYWRKGNRDSAKAELERALKIAPNDPQLRKNWYAIQEPNAAPNAFEVPIEFHYGDVKWTVPFP